ncbi:hypothetical protein DVH26_30935 [Paenibacillus sp. H1-7]|nr:hypothetical protein DVH26_30935 [Paenibacillus sp. H1-7]
MLSCGAGGIVRWIAGWRLILEGQEGGKLNCLRLVSRVVKHKRIAGLYSQGIAELSESEVRSE